MTFNILSQNLLLLVCVVVTALFMILISSTGRSLIEDKKRNAKQQPSKKYHLGKQFRLLGGGIVLSLACALFLRMLVNHYTGSTTPFGLTFMILPITLSAVLCIATFICKTQPRVKAASTCCLLFSILFSLLLINDYYRYFPTLGSIFNKNQAIALNAHSSKQVLLSFTPANNISLLNSSSVEYYLTSISGQPTNGRVYSINIPGTVSKFHARKAYVYVPAIYNNPTVVYLPVVVLTAGFPGQPESWLNAGLEATLNGFAKHHDGITPLVFVVDNTGSLTNDTECVDSSRGNVETYLSVDVPNYIKANFNTETDPSHWAIGGLSLGGMCSIMVTLRHTDVYHYFLDFGGEEGPEVGSDQKTIKEIFNDSKSAWQQHQPIYLLHNHTYKGIGGFFAVGNADERRVTDATSTLSASAQKAGIETIYETVNGQHTFSVWSQAFKQSLPWVSNRTGATECQTTCY